MPTNSNDYDRHYRSLRKESIQTLISMMLNMQEEMKNLRKEVANLRKESTLLNGSPSGSPLHPLPKPLLNPPLISHFVRESANSTFARWWEGYPEKIGKGAARKAFERALTKTSLDQLITGLEYYKTNKPKDRAWCHPATWLNQERWTDSFENRHTTSEHKPRYGRIRDPTEIAKELGLKP